MSLLVEILHNIFKKCVQYLKGKKIRIKKKIFQSYLSFSDISFLDPLIKKAFNCDIKKGSSYTRNVEFYTNFLWLLFIWFLYLWQTMECCIYWRNQEMITVGCFPRETTILGTLASCICIVMILVSIKVLKGDNNLTFNMRHLAAIYRGHDDECHLDSESINADLQSKPPDDECHLDSYPFDDKRHLSIDEEIMKQVRGGFVL